MFPKWELIATIAFDWVFGVLFLWAQKNRLKLTEASLAFFNRAFHWDPPRIIVFLVETCDNVNE